ncbi:hypothetical protein J2R76_003771 [Bradyrhizobium sp. USDA 4532]|nr:hypothetical protein [Bradyrhizobium sp. USDA 4545]MCP1920180.1 hypothetical protein [Bradyrhizobium sp. USDA 4532]
MNSKQALRDFTIAIPFQPPVHATQSEDVPMPRRNRLSERRPSNRALFERQPKLMCCLQTDIEVAI